MADERSALIACGSRDWTSNTPIYEFMSQLPAGSTVLHGGCRGADKIAAQWAGYFGHHVIPHPYKANLGRGGGPARNAEMLAQLLGYRRLEGWRIQVVAFHDDPNVETAEKGGTADMLRRARAAGVETRVIRSR